MTILHRTDTNEYLTHFEFWDRNSMQWFANVNDAFLFRSHSDAEINGRMVLEWLGDPLNRVVGLSCANMEIRDDQMTVGQWCSVNVTWVAGSRVRQLNPRRGGVECCLGGID
jgi:hypothetical protein